MSAKEAAPTKSRAGRRLALLVAPAALVLLGTGGYWYFWRDLPMGSGPAGPPVAREAFGRTWTERPVLLLGLGDSITAGYGASPGQGYFDRLVRNPPGEFPDMQGITLSAVLPGLRTRNVSVSGSISEEHLGRQIEPLDKADPKTLGLVVITTGGNDLIHNYGRTPPREGAMYGATLEQARPWISGFERRLGRMFDLLDERFPGGCEIFLANIYDPTDGIGDAKNAGLPAWPEGLQVIRAYNDVIARAAEQRKNVHLVDIRGAFLGHGIHCRQFWRPFYRPEDPHYWYFENLEDPNDRGYDAIRRLFLIEMARVLAPS